MEIATDFLLLYCYVHPHDKEYKKMKNVYNKLKLHNKLSNMHLKKKSIFIIEFSFHADLKSVGSSRTLLTAPLSPWLISDWLM